MRELSASVDFLATIEHALDGTPLAFASAADQVISGELTKGLNTYAAILQLCLDGFDVQAEMLTTALFESCILAAWTSLHPEIARDRFDLHARYVANLYYESRVAAGVFHGLGLAPHPLTESDREAAVTFFGPSGDRGWTGRDLRQMAEEINARIGASSLAQADAHLNVIMRGVNWTLHSTMMGSLRTLDSHPEGSSFMTIGPHSTGIYDALLTGWNLGYQLVGTTIDYFGWDWERELQSAGYLVWESMLPISVARDLVRSNPCPCGSGRKFKNCHLRLK